VGIGDGLGEPARESRPGRAGPGESARESRPGRVGPGEPARKRVACVRTHNARTHAHRHMQAYTPLQAKVLRGRLCTVGHVTRARCGVGRQAP
jgi:hypothetical protein